MDRAWQKVQTAYRPSTVSSHQRQFKTFLAFIVFMDLPRSLTPHNVLAFLEYLHQNSLSPKVIRNYLSSMKTMCTQFHIDHSALSHYTISRYLRSLSINSTFRPTPRGVFDLHTLYKISVLCDSLHDPLLFRAIFLVAFYGFLRMSNIAPHSSKLFSQDIHFLRQDVIFAPPGIHLIIKWTKTLQDHKAHHVVQLPTISNPYLCPVRAVRSLLKTRPLPPTAPLFANSFPPFNQIIDTHIRDALKKILSKLHIPAQGHGFHTFRRSGATLAFDNNVSLQNIMSHGLWRSSAVWTYLQNASAAPSIIPTTFSSLISSSF